MDKLAEHWRAFAKHTWIPAWTFAQSFKRSQCSCDLLEDNNDKFTVCIFQAILFCLKLDANHAVMCRACAVGYSSNNNSKCLVIRHPNDGFIALNWFDSVVKHHINKIFCWRNQFWFHPESITMAIHEICWVLRLEHFCRSLTISLPRFRPELHVLFSVSCSKYLLLFFFL